MSFGTCASSIGRLCAAMGIFLMCSLSTPAVACDVCAVYVSTEMSESRTGFSLGVAEQFTHFGTLQLGGEEVANPANEHMESSITQLLFSYAPIPRLHFQLNLPIIARYYRRIEADGVVSGDESGIGDLALTGLFNVWSHVDESSVVRFSLFGGVKFPTGNSDRLGEELDEGHHSAGGAADGEEEHEDGGDDEQAHGEEGHVRLVARHVLDEGDDEHGASGIHGHDLALGSGSYDGIVGGRLFASWRRAFLSATVQYTPTTEGDFDYAYADGLTWSGGPGAYAWLGHDSTLGLMAVLSGQTKGNDELDGVKLDDTAATSLFVGPGLVFSWGTSLAVDIAGDLPVIQSNTGLQIVADFRIRGGAVWRF
jgi:hypothetical protein